MLRPRQAYGASTERKIHQRDSSCTHPCFCADSTYTIAIRQQRTASPLAQRVLVCISYLLFLEAGVSCLEKDDFMAELKELLQERLKALDDGRDRYMEVYHRRREAVLTTMEWVAGGAEDEPEPVVDALKPGTTRFHLLADHDRSPSSPIDTDMHGVSKAYVGNQLNVVMGAIRQMPDVFNKNALRQKLEGSEWRELVTDNTIANLSSFLWQLHKNGMIKIQEKGQGHRQSVYMVPEKEKEPPTGTTP
jgi:hypothetical protein